MKDLKKSKFGNLNFDKIEVLSQAQQQKVKGGGYGSGPSNCGTNANMQTQCA